MRRTVLSFAVLLVLAGCGGGNATSAARTASPAPLTLADGTTATSEQTAYLAEVKPSLTAPNAADTLKVLSSGQSLCDTFLHPSYPGVQPSIIELLMQTSGYNLSEATAITRSAVKNFCPGK